MRKKLVALLAGAMLMMATSALATPINDNRPVVPGSSSETTLDAVLKANFNNSLGVADQSNVGGWETTDGSPKAYSVAFFRGDAGSLFIYSLSDYAKEYALLNNPGLNSVKSFGIMGVDLVDADNNVLVANFGTSFGFYWQDTTVANKSYTEDSRNIGGFGPANNIKALTFLVKDGTTLTGNIAAQMANNTAARTATGNDDWVIAFEDRVNGDFDFNDSVFYIKDIAPVPEPGTMMLLGIGMLGMAIYGKRRMNKEA